MGKKLSNNQDLDAAILEAIEDIIIVLDRKGKIVRFNHVSERISGYSSKDVLGARLWDFLLAPGSIKEIKNVFDNIEKIKNLDHQEISWITKSGNNRYMSFTTKALHDQAGKVKFILGIGVDTTEKKKREQRFSQKEEQLLQIINLVPHGIYVKDFDGRFLLANRTAADVFGITIEQLTGKLITEVHPNMEEAKRCMEEDREIIAKNISKDIVEETFTEKSGKKRYFHTYKVPFKTGESEKNSVLGVSVELTESRKNMEQLRRFSMFVEQSTEGIALVDLEGNLLFSNRAFAEIHGMSVEETKGKNQSFFHAKEWLPRFQEINRQIIQKGSFKGEVWHVRKDGTEFPALVNTFLLKDENGKPFGLIGTMHDITEQRKIEAELKQSELLFRTTIEALPLAVVILDSEFKIMYYNQEFKVDENIEGKDYMEAFPFLSNEVKEELNLVLKTGKEVVSERSAFFDGREMFYIAHRLPVVEDGKVVRIILVLQDITADKKTEELMIRSSRMEATATLAGGIAHDFNNLMSGVLGNAELLEEEFKDNTMGRKMLGKIIKSAEHAGELAQLLVAYARGGKYHPKILDLNETFEENFLLQEGSFPAMVEFKRNLQEGLWTVEADPVQMGQVLMNLCINAVESIEGNGEVVISTCNIKIGKKKLKKYSGLKPGCYVCLSVKDNGCGMKRETISRVFEPFFSTKNQGRGLGLSAVYGIVENHGGKILIHSVKGKGSTFEVYLPVKEGEVIKKVELETGIPRGNETVLIIDDDKTVREITRTILERLGYKVLLAGEGKEAIGIVSDYKGEISLAILDMSMPVMDGVEAFPVLKAARQNMKIIICSGYEPDEASKELMALGASAFLQKPFRMEKLGHMVRQLLDEE